MAFQSDCKLIMLVLLVALEQLVAKPSVPCFFIFGDSTNDNGNTNQFPAAPAKFLPYGIDFPDGPTGRYSNGRTFVDVVEQFLGFDNFIPPYANANASGGDILQGVNYAFAGSGILDATGNRWGQGKIASFNDQLKQHQYIVSEIMKILGHDSTTYHLNKCLYYVDIGNNDIGNYFGRNNISRQYTLELYANFLIETYSQKIKELYNYGARKMILTGAGLIGCSPMALAHSPPTSSQCLDYMNLGTRIFNDKHKSLVGYLNKNFPDAKFTYLDASATWQELLDNPSQYGFKATTTACCGAGRNRGWTICHRNQIPCKNRDEYLYWDFAHPTDAANVIVARKLFSHEAELFTYPFTISQLAGL